MDTGVRTLLAAWVLLGGTAARAEEHVVKDYNFAIGLPAGEEWAPLPQGVLPASTVHQLGVTGRSGKTIVLRVSRLGDSADMDEERFQAEFRRGVLHSMPGARVVEDSRGQVADMTARMLRLETAGAKPGKFAIASLVARPYHYALLVVATEGQEPEPEFSRTLRTFRLLRAPPLPRERGLAYRIGYRIGTWVFPVLLLVAIVSFNRRRSRRRRAG